MFFCSIAELQFGCGLMGHGIRLKRFRFSFTNLHKFAPSQIAHRAIGMRSQSKAPLVVFVKSWFHFPNSKCASAQPRYGNVIMFVYPRSPDREAVAAEHGDMLWKQNGLDEIERAGGVVDLLRFDGSAIEDNLHLRLPMGSLLTQLSRNSKGRTGEFEKPDPINYVFCLLLGVQWLCNFLHRDRSSAPLSRFDKSTPWTPHSQTPATTDPTMGFGRRATNL